MHRRRITSPYFCITDYKGKNSSDAQPVAFLPNELPSELYTQFEASNTTPTLRKAENQDDCTRSLTRALRRVLRIINDVDDDDE